VIADMDTSFFPMEENLTLWLGQRNIKDFLFKVKPNINTFEYIL
jgi:hypothetical protein